MTHHLINGFDHNSANISAKGICNISWETFDGFSKAFYGKRELVFEGYCSEATFSVNGTESFPRHNGTFGKQMGVSFILQHFLVRKFGFKN